MVSSCATSDACPVLASVIAVAAAPFNMRRSDATAVGAASA